MHPSLRLRGGDTLHAVHAALILQRAIDALARHRADDFLEASGRTFVGAGNFQPPALALAILGVHAEEVAGKEGRLVAARAPPDFQDGVAAVLRVGRDEQELDFLLQLGPARLAAVQLLAGHFTHLRVALVGNDVLGLVDAGQHLDVFPPCLHQVAQFLVFLRQLDVTLLVGNDGRVGYQGGYFLVAGHEGVEFLE